MRFVLMDFVKRWRWVFIIPLATAALAYVEEWRNPNTGLIGLWLLGGVVLASLDAQRGVAKVYRTLPASRAVVARAIWLEAVVLFPAVFAGLAVVLHMLGIRGMPQTPLYLSAVLPTAFLGMGVSGLLMLFWPYAPTRQPSSFLEQVRAGAFMLPTIGVCIAFLHGLRHLDLSLARALDMPNLALLAGAALFMAWSYVRAEAVLRGRLAGRDSGEHALRRHPEAIVFPSRRKGFLDPWRVDASLAVAMVLSVVVFLGIMGAVAGQRELLFQTPFMFVMLVVITTFGRAPHWLACMRAFRALPLSPRRLAVLLLSFPALAFVCVALCCLVAAAVFGTTSVWIEALPWMCATLGVGLAAVAACLRWGFVVTMVAAWAGMSLVGAAFVLVRGGVLSIPEPLTAALPWGLFLILAAAGVAGVHYLIRHSSRIYHHRFPGQRAVGMR